MVNRYRQRVSGPLLDRIDLQLHVARPALAQLESVHTQRSEGESSSGVGQRVQAARSIQLARDGVLNHALPAARLSDSCRTDAPVRELLRAAGQRYGLSARAYHRILRVARTVADLAGASALASAHVAEALGWRVVLEQRWAGQLDGGQRPVAEQVDDRTSEAGGS